MITTSILIILGLLLVVVLVLMIKAPRGAKQVAAPEIRPAVAAGPSASDLFGARPGDVVSIPAAAEDYSDLDFTIDRRSSYAAGGKKWVDLSGEFRDRRVYLEVQPGPEPEVMGLLGGRKLTLAEIHATEDQLADMDAKQNPWLYLEFEGKRWQYQSSREIAYFENETGPGEGLYRWLFTEQDGKRLLCIEKWEGEPFDVRLAQRLEPRDINVYRAA